MDLHLLTQCVLLERLLPAVNWVLLYAFLWIVLCAQWMVVSTLVEFSVTSQIQFYLWCVCHSLVVVIWEKGKESS